MKVGRRFPEEWRDLPKKRIDRPREFLDIKQRLFKEIPQVREGVDFEGIKRFFESYHLPGDGEVLAFDAENAEVIADIERILEEIDLASKGDDIAHAAWYLSPIDLIFLPRDRKQEELNGSLFASGLLVHESVHAMAGEIWSSCPFIQLSSDSYPRAFNTRLGFAVQKAPSGKPRGDFLEEGFAQFMRGKYLEERSGYDASRFLKEIGIDSSITSFEPMIFSDDYDNDIFFSVKYFYRVSEKRHEITPSSYAAQALEFIIETDPSIFNLFIESRRNPLVVRAIYSRIKSLLGEDVCKKIRHADYYKRNNFSNVYRIIAQKLEKLPI